MTIPQTKHICDPKSESCKHHLSAIAGSKSKSKYNRFKRIAPLLLAGYSLVWLVAVLSLDSPNVVMGYVVAQTVALVAVAVALGAREWRYPH